MKRTRLSFNCSALKFDGSRPTSAPTLLFLVLSLVIQIGALPTQAQTPSPSPSVSVQTARKTPPRSIPQTTIEREEGKIPKNPSAPPPLWQQTPLHSERCRRTFIYRGEMLGCDSVVSTDASGLRSILGNTPEALVELGAYQQGRRSIRQLAYLGTGGLLLAFLGPSIARSIGDAKTSSVLASFCTIGGIGLTGGVVVLGGLSLRNNEQHLRNAVDLYNQANPKDPIQLQFSTSFSF